MDFLPLQAADLWAWWVRKKHKGALPNGSFTLGQFDSFSSREKTIYKMHFPVAQDILVRIFLQLARESIHPEFPVYDMIL